MFSVDYNGPLWRGTRRWPPVHDSRAVEARLLVAVASPSRVAQRCLFVFFVQLSVAYVTWFIGNCLQRRSPFVNIIMFTYLTLVLWSVISNGLDKS